MHPKLLPAILWSSLKNAAWAPGLVLLLRYILIKLNIRHLYDHSIHYLGGFAIAYFLFRVIRYARPILGELSPAARYTLALTSGCTTALFWEFSEWASDRITGGHIQHNVFETLYDLLYGTLGILSALVLIAIVRFSQQQLWNRKP